MSYYAQRYYLDCIENGMNHSQAMKSTMGYLRYNKKTIDRAQKS